MNEITAREFQKGYARQTEPVRVSGGTWFPNTYSWKDILEVATEELARTGNRLEAMTSGREPSKPKGKLDFSKQAQAKGKMGR